MVAGTDGGTGSATRGATVGRSSAQGVAGSAFIVILPFYFLYFFWGLGIGFHSCLFTFV